MGNKQVSPTTALRELLEHREWKLMEPGGLSELMRQSWESKETKAVRVQRTEYQKGESWTKNSGETERVSNEYLAKYWSKKGLEATVPGTHTEPVTVPSPTKLEKTINHRVLNRVLRKGLPQLWKTTSPRLSTAPGLPNKSRHKNDQTVSN